MLLAINSRYGKMTAEGLYEFLNEPNFEIDLQPLTLHLDFPEIDIDNFNKGFGIDNEVNDNKIAEPSNKEKRCPNCDCLL
jgi:hypothetical protein